MVDTPNFDLKPTFPIATVIDAAQRKTVYEQQFKQQQNELLLKGIQDIGTASKSIMDMRRAQAQALAGANLLAQTPQGKILMGTNQVTTGPNGQPVTMNQTASGTDAQGNLQDPTSNQSPVNVKTLASALHGVAPKELLSQLFPQMVNQNIYQTDAAGNIIGQKTVQAPKGSSVTVTKPQPVGGGAKDERVRQMAAAKVKEKTTTDINEIARGSQQIESLFNKYQSLVKQGYAGGPIEGNYAKAKSFLTGGGLGTEDVKAFLDVRNGLIASLKRVTGDSGVLTEQDAVRLVGLLSSLTEDPKAAESKIAEIRSIFNTARVRAESKGNNLIQEIQSGADITPVDSQKIFDIATAEKTPAATEVNPDLVHLSTKELMDLREKMTAHTKVKK